GIAVVKEMDRLGMVLDLSHLSEPCFYDALELSEYPQLVTHANAKALHDHPRNLSDEQIRRLAAKGGVVGVCFFPRFLQSRTIDGVIDHLDYVVQMVGIDHVGIGPDFIDYMLDLFESPGQLALRAMSDPMPAYPPGIEDMTKLPSFTEGLVRRGYREPDVRKILGENFLRVYRQVLQ
ncbi:MAG: membrane dipeptidase, partial [Chloroflexi bacterium]|nr:membrane dipeptidase [Chloroflexota bacterium]